MNNSIIKSAILSASVVALAAPLTPALAQDAPPPPEQDTESATGVSLVSGGYSTSATDLSIGQGEFPQALTLTREYSSSMNKAHGTNDGILSWGWSTNLTMYITVGELGGNDYPPDEPPITNERYPWRYGIAQGTGSLASFVELDPNSPVDPYIGPNYEGPFGVWGDPFPGSLVRTGNELIFTAIDGTKHIFEEGSQQVLRDNSPAFRTRLEAKDGTVLTFHGKRGADAVFSNRGIAILFEFDPNVTTQLSPSDPPFPILWTKSCAVNLAEHYVTPTSTCPAGVPSVSYQHTTLPNGFRLLTGVTDQLNNQTTYEYTADEQLECIKLPGQSSCQVFNHYSNCMPIPNEPSNFSMNSFQQVYRQDLITGETITYDFDTSRYCPLKPPGSGQYAAPYSEDVTMTYADGSTKTVRATYEGLPLKVTDALGRETTMVHGIENFANREIHLTEVIAEEGNSWNYDYHGTGQVTKTTIKPKTGAGSQVWETVYGGADVCYQPTAQIDAEGNQTDIVYDTTHCGILKRTLPAAKPGDPRPETRYTWAQQYAWTKNSSTGYSQEATPIWVLISEEFCKTSAYNGSACAAGASDLVVTTYEYQQGNASKGSNLFRVGMAVTADGQTLRTCYGLDYFGRQISETQPKAGLASCQ